MTNGLSRLVIVCATLSVFATVTAAETVYVCFQQGDSAVLVQRAIPPGASAVEMAINALVAGPTAEETQQGLISAIPSGVNVTAIAVSGDTVSVDLSTEILSGLNEAALTDIFNQFRATLGDFAEIASIRLTSQGALLASYLPPAPVVGVPAAPLTSKSGLGVMATGLSGRNITIGPSHGRFWNGSGWYWQRAIVCSAGENLLEDTNSIRLCQFLNQYLTQDGATVHVPRDLNESDCCHPEIGYPWWKMCAQSWLRQNGLPCSVWGSSSGNCGADSAASRSSDDIRARPLFADYRGSDIYIAHHTNAGGGGTANGTETFRDTAMEHPAHETNSYNLALAVNNNVINSIREMYDGAWSNRGVKDSAGGFGEIRIPDRPAILIELAFHDNCSRDGLYLQDNFFRSVAEWGIYKGVCEYFGTTPTWDKYSDEVVSNTIPAVMGAGQSYPVSVTFRNRGVVWTTARSFRLGAAGDSDPFTSFTRMDISGEVRPGSTYTFNFTMTAPATSGTYTTDWRMVRDGVAWFGATLTKQVTVSGGGPMPPLITQHPANQTIAPYGTATFTVQAVGDAPLSYQWQKDGSDLSNGGKISGATAGTLQVINADGTDQGSYRCVVTNAYGSTTSNAASLAIAPTVFMVESRSGGKNYTKYAETGAWGDTTGKSVASGVTGGIGARYGSTYRSVAGEKHATFSADLALTGPYQVYATWGIANNRRTPILHRITHAGGTTDVNVDQAVTANVWQSLGTYTFNAGTNVGKVDVNNLNIDASGSMYADAVKWEYRGTLQPPTITQQPASQSLCFDSTATFTVAATGTGTLTYQWQKDDVNLSDGGDIAGALTAALTISNVVATDAANYRCAVSNAGGSTNSNQAALTVKAGTTVTGHPSAQDVCSGAAVAFSVTATGNGTVSYQWQKNGADLSDAGNVSGATTSAININPAADGDAGAYRCIVTAGCGSETSNEAELTVRTATAISEQPQSQTVSVTTAVTFSVAASGDGALTYQWQKNDVDLPGETSDSLQVPNAHHADAGNYRCIITAGCGSATSDEAALTVFGGAADFDEDADIDLNDFAMFQACFNGPNRPATPDCAINADLDGDNDIDLLDFAQFQACFNGPNRPATPECPQR